MIGNVIIMATATTLPDTPTETGRHVSYVEWGAVFAGAVASLAVSLVLMTFGAAVGLSAVSPWTSSSATVTAVGIGSAFWILLVSAWSFALGGYLAGRLRHRLVVGQQSEVEFRDNAHGLLAWALAVALIGFAAVLSAPRMTAPDQMWTAPLATSRAVDTIVRAAKADIAASDPTLRAMVGRTLAANLGAATLNADDEAYLARLVAERSGIDDAAAKAHVSRAFAQFKGDANRARRAGVIMGFLTAATLLVSGAIAWWAAGVGGAHRDQGTVWHVFRRGRPVVIART